MKDRLINWPNEYAYRRGRGRGKARIWWFQKFGPLLRWKYFFPENQLSKVQFILIWVIKLFFFVFIRAIILHRFRLLSELPLPLFRRRDHQLQCILGEKIWQQYTSQIERSQCKLHRPVFQFHLRRGESSVIFGWILPYVYDRTYHGLQSTTFIKRDALSLTTAGRTSLYKRNL